VGGPSAYRLCLRRGGIDLCERHHAIRVAIGKLVPQDGFDDTEDRGAGSDGQGERQYGDRGEARGPAQRPEGETQVGKTNVLEIARAAKKHRSLP